MRPSASSTHNASFFTRAFVGSGTRKVVMDNGCCMLHAGFKPIQSSIYPGTCRPAYKRRRQTYRIPAVRQRSCPCVRRLGPAICFGDLNLAPKQTKLDEIAYRLLQSKIAPDEETSRGHNTPCGKTSPMPHSLDARRSLYRNLPSHESRPLRSIAFRINPIEVYLMLVSTALRRQLRRKPKQPPRP